MSVDWKLIGYSISSVSVLLLALVAWPGSKGEDWRMPALVGGSLLSILGMVCRYISHRKEHAAIQYAQQQADKAKHQGGG
jgi:hypothetical protein